ncbi:MAG: hypothetical protein H6515_00190 [Microthrixaceae bacterium]|nr:hypothetical protein [Microthrixaceae bacterium]
MGQPGLPTPPGPVTRAAVAVVPTSRHRGRRRPVVIASVIAAAIASVLAFQVVPVVAGASGAAGTGRGPDRGWTTTTVAPRTAPAPAPSSDVQSSDVEAPPSTPAPAPTVPSTTTPALEARATESEQATTRLNRIVIALLVLAAVIAGATVYFWMRTRPDRSRPTGRSERRGAVLVTADGHEEPLVDPGPAAGLRPPVGEDAWRVRPAPQLGGTPAQVGAGAAEAAPEPRPAQGSSTGWWASQEPDQAPTATGSGPRDRPEPGPDTAE